MGGCGALEKIRCRSIATKAILEVKLKIKLDMKAMVQQGRECDCDGSGNENNEAL